MEVKQFCQENNRWALNTSVLQQLFWQEWRETQHQRPTAGKPSLLLPLQPHPPGEHNPSTALEKTAEIMRVVLWQTLSVAPAAVKCRTKMRLNLQVAEWVNWDWSDECGGWESCCLQPHLPQTSSRLTWKLGEGSWNQNIYQKKTSQNIRSKGSQTNRYFWTHDSLTINIWSI